jgi:uncharacterized protein YpuA (DUF1002 family)
MKLFKIKWSTPDVLDVAKNMNIELTEQEADKILDSLEYYHDAELGINWLVIENYIQDHADKKNN